MSENEVITLLREQNLRLLSILEKFAEKDINIVVNSYNGSSAQSHLDQSEEHNEKANYTTTGTQQNHSHK